jgi:hypothetical protein
MNKTFYIILISSTLLLSISALCGFNSYQENNFPKKIPETGFAVLELFTSQGCSSCPPADAVLGSYAAINNPKIIPLAFHIDYWNNLGWNDPFSKPQFSQRQRQYADYLKVNGTYTPQLVINGKHELIGSRKKEIDKLITDELAKENQLSIKIKSINLDNNKLNVVFETNCDNSSATLNFGLVKKTEITNIKRGENRGVSLTNFNIVYDFNTIKETKNVNTINFLFKPEWETKDFFVVAFSQNIKSGAITAATKSSINN